MIALVLGLLVVSAAVAVFLSNKDSYRTNTALGQVQENSRIAFELLARDIRQAGITGCGNAGRVANVLRNGTIATTTPDWYADFGNVIRGFDSGAVDSAVTSGSGSAERVETESSLMLLGAAMTSVSVASYDSSTYTFTLNGPNNTGLATGDLIMVCDADHAVMAQITGTGGGTIVVDSTAANSPGNCSRGLGIPTVCTTAGTAYIFAANAIISPLLAVDWYIGNNLLGGRSLYRRTVVPVSGVPTLTSQEMVRNVTGMRITYHIAGANDFALAAAIPAADWATVDAVQMNLTLEGSDLTAGTDRSPIRRTFSSTVNLRNRS